MLWKLFYGLFWKNSMMSLQKNVLNKKCQKMSKLSLKRMCNLSSLNAKIKSRSSKNPQYSAYLEEYRYKNEIYNLKEAYYVLKMVRYRNVEKCKFLLQLKKFRFVSIIYVVDWTNLNCYETIAFRFLYYLKNGARLIPITFYCSAHCYLEQHSTNKAFEIYYKNYFFIQKYFAKLNHLILN